MLCFVSKSLCCYTWNVISPDLQQLWFSFDIFTDFCPVKHPLSTCHRDLLSIYSWANCRMQRVIWCNALNVNNRILFCFPSLFFLFLHKLNKIGVLASFWSLISSCNAVQHLAQWVQSGGLRCPVSSGTSRKSSEYPKLVLLLQVMYCQSTAYFSYLGCV